MKLKRALYVFMEKMKFGLLQKIWITVKLMEMKKKKKHGLVYHMMLKQEH